jgi:hypothetical protein
MLPFGHCESEGTPTSVFCDAGDKFTSHDFFIWLGNFMLNKFAAKSCYGFL